MTQTGVRFVGPDSPQTHNPGDRLGAYLRRQYPHHGAKRLARDLGCTPKAAENMIGGKWPNGRLFGYVVRRFGQDLIDALFGTDIDRARLEEEVRELEAQLERKRAGLTAGGPGLRPGEGAVARGQGRLAAAERRAFG